MYTHPCFLYAIIYVLATKRKLQFKYVRHYQPPQEQCYTIADVQGRVPLTSNIQIPDYANTLVIQ